MNISHNQSQTHYDRFISHSQGIDNHIMGHMNSKKNVYQNKHFNIESYDTIY